MPESTTKAQGLLVRFEALNTFAKLLISSTVILGVLTAAVGFGFALKDGYTETVNVPAKLNTLQAEIAQGFNTLQRSQERQEAALDSVIHGQRANTRRFRTLQRLNCDDPAFTSISDLRKAECRALDLYEEDNNNTF